MSGPFLSAVYRTNCYHCGAVSDQRIIASPFRAEVICENCHATRVYIPRIEDVSPEGMYIPPECYDVWGFDTPASCRHCGVSGPHGLAIGCRRFTARCRNCGFTHFYRFDLEFIDTSADPGPA